MLKSEGERLTRVAVCCPRSEYFRVDDLQTHNIREIADPERAVRQHEALTALLTSRGVEVVDIGECPGHPNSVFTRDMAVGSPGGYIQASMGIASRIGEEFWMADALKRLGEPLSGIIRPPGTVEGGDVVLVGPVAFVGYTRRTNPEGIRQLTTIFNSFGVEVRIVVLPDIFLHLDQILGVLGPDKLLVCHDLIPDHIIRGFRSISLPCKRFNVNLICLGPDEIIVPSTNLPLIESAAAIGVRVHALDLSEFAKGTGGPNCLIMPIERL
jgi:dimethylargininase